MKPHRPGSLRDWVPPPPGVPRAEGDPKLDTFEDPREDPDFDAGAHWKKLMTMGRIHICEEQQERPPRSVEPRNFVPYEEPPPDEPEDLMFPYNQFCFGPDIIGEFRNLSMFRALGVKTMREVLLKKCKEVKCDDILSLDCILPLIKPPRHVLGRNGLVVLQHAPAIPEHFYVVFKKDISQIELIQRYLTMAVEQDMLPEFGQNAPRFGDIVACLNSKSGLYERGKVVGPLDPIKETLPVFCIDNGKTVQLPLSWLRVIVIELRVIPGYALKCNLGTKFVHDWNDDIVFTLEEYIKTTFVSTKERKSIVRCNITCRDEVEGNNLVRIEVAFKKPVEAMGKLLGPPTDPVDIGEVIEEFKPVIDANWIKHEIENKAQEPVNKMLCEPWVNYINESFKFPINLIQRFKVTSIENAEYLWVEHIPCDHWRKIAPWALAFQKQEYREKFRLVGNPVLNRYYAWLCPRTGVAERVKVVSYDPESCTIRIRLIDSGMFARLRLSDCKMFYELQRRFCVLPVTGFRAYLKHISIKPGLEKEYVQFLKHSTNNVVFDGLVMDFKGHFKDQEPLLGLVLINPCRKLTLNAEMVQEGYAASTGILSWPYYFVPIPSHNIDQERVATELQLQFPQVDLRPNPTPPRSSSYQIERKIRSHLPQVYITNLTTASWIVMQPSHLKGFLDTMESNMNKLAPYIPIQYKYEPFDLVMVYMEIPELKLGPKWHRGLVRSFIYSVELTKGICVDYGTDFSVKPQYIRPLPQPYCNVPGICFRAHFDLKGLVPLGGTKNQWTSSSSDFLRRYVLAWASKEANYYAYRPNDVPGIQLDNYRQTLQYNPVESKWEAKPVTVGDGDPLSEKKDHPMIHQFFVSYGMDIWYELWYHGQGYRFQRLCDHLVEKNHAAFIKNV